MKTLAEEMKKYYSLIDGNYMHVDSNAAFLKMTREIQVLLDEEEREQSEWPGVLLKARLQEIIAERFEPVIFPHSPFYFEMGITPAKNWGTPWSEMPGSILFRQRYEWFWKDHPQEAEELKLRTELNLDTHPGPVDFDHHYYNYSRVLKSGLHGVLEDAECELSRCKNDEETAFIRAAIMSINAVLLIADKFAAKAREMLGDKMDAESSKFLEMIAETASEVPRRAPRSFYEGLACIWFLREVCGSVDAIGVSVLGHPDRQLIGLYRADIEAGRITREEAEDLIARWMLPTDCKFNLDENAWPETSATLMLGGCDETGAPVYNELTAMFIEQHHKHNLINPKLNCRYGHFSPSEYFHLLGDKILAGHNVFALINDDVLISANQKYGKRLEDCRNYGAGGCQETIVEGVEHSAGAYYYLNLPLVLTLLMNPYEKNVPLLDLYPRHNSVLSDFADFEAFYTRILEWLHFYLRHGAETRTKCGVHWPEINPAPFYSAALYDCLLNHRDYTAGGGRYNPSGISLCGFGTMVDALYAVKKMCFEQEVVTVPELSEILRANWRDNEVLRRKVIALPKFGHGIEEVDELASRLADDLYAMTSGIRNERGGPVQLSFFVYYQFVYMSRETPATSDGRCDGEMFSQGIAPGRLQPAEEITSAINSLDMVDFSNYPGNAVLDLQLPLGGISCEHLEAVIRGAGVAGVPTLQFNCVNIDDLKQAQVEPEKYRNLTVRISGLSARFVALDCSVQDEIISRNMFT